MEKTCRSDIASFPQLFSDIEPFVSELGAGLRRTSVRFAVVAIPGCSLLLFALSKVH